MKGLGRYIVTMAVAGLGCGGGGADAGVDGGMDAGPVGARDAGPAGFDAYLECDRGGRCEIRCGLEAPFEGEPTESLRIGDTVDGAFEPWMDGQDVPMVWGFQGGVMITPVVALDPAVARSEVCFDLTLDNAEDVEHPGHDGELSEFRRLEQQVLLVDVGGQLLTERLNDQLGWSTAHDVWIDLVATLRGRSFAARGRLRVRVADPEAETCGDYPAEGSGCAYRRIPGVATIDALEATDGACADPVRVAFTFAPDDPAAAECYTDPRTTGHLEGVMSSACLEAAGRGVGGTLPMDRRDIVAGGCSPLIWEPAVDLSGCVCP